MSGAFINVTIPAHNEERVLVRNVSKIHQFLAPRFPRRFEIVIAENGSTDATLARAGEVAGGFSEVRLVHLETAGRGGALRRAWSESDADVLTYMDCDLSTGLESFPPLVEAVASGAYDLAVGSRVLPGSRTTRSLRRELISRSYNLLVRALFRAQFSDAQCGFKAIRRLAAVELLPLVVDNGWFFDTELLVTAATRGYRIHDLPVGWVEEPDSHVRLWSTALSDIRGLLRLRRRFAGSNLSARGPQEISG